MEHTVMVKYLCVQKYEEIELSKPKQAIKMNNLGCIYY